MGVQLGLDVAQVQDRTAFVVVETDFRQRDIGGHESTFTVRHLERFPQRMSYPAQADEVLDRIDGVLAKTSSLVLTVDVTDGGGKAMCDQLRLSLRRRHGAVLHQATFTGGDPSSWNPTVGYAYPHIPKMAFVQRLQSLLAWRRIFLPRTKEARALAEELRNFEIRSAGVHDIAGAFRTGTHDDLVTALGLACFEPSAPGSMQVHWFDVGVRA